MLIMAFGAEVLNNLVFGPSGMGERKAMKQQVHIDGLMDGWVDRWRR